MVSPMSLSPPDNSLTSRITASRRQIGGLGFAFAPWWATVVGCTSLSAMVSKTTVVVTDDFDGSEGAATVRFGLDGREYEVDLSPENEAEFRGFLNHYTAVGRKLTKSGRAYREVASPPDSRAVRAWAQANGVEVSSRGRISADVIAAYEAAGN